jgi:hypothetical protein
VHKYKTLNTDSDLDGRRSHKTLLTEFGANSRKMHNMKVIDNVKTFPERINTPSYDQQFSSYDHYKLRGAARTQFWTDQATWTSLDFKAIYNGNLEEL